MCRGNRKRDVTTMVIYSHASTPFGQSERAYYLSYFIICNNTLYFPVGYKSLSEVSRSHNRGRRPQARAISSIGVDPMIWDNFSIFRTNCAIACSTRAYIAARIFADVAQGKWRPKFPKSFMAVGILPKYFRGKMLHFEWRQCRI